MRRFGRGGIKPTTFGLRGGDSLIRLFEMSDVRPRYLVLSRVLRRLPASSVLFRTSLAREQRSGHLSGSATNQELARHYWIGCEHAIYQHWRPHLTQV